MTTVRIPLIGAPHHRSYGDSNVKPSSSAIDQKFVNVIFREERNPVSGATRFKVIKRPGIENGTSVSNVEASTNPIGVCRSTSTNGANAYAFSVWKSSTANNIRLQLDNSQSGNIAITGPRTSSRPVLLNVDGTPKFYFHIVTANSANKAGYLATQATPPVQTAITDADFPDATIVGSFAAIDGYLFIATSDGSIWNSDLNSDTAWTSTSFIDNNSQQYARGVFNYKDKIGLFSEDSIEFFENVGAPTGSPLQRIDHLTQKSYGLPFRSATVYDTSHWYLTAFDTVFWINNASAGTTGVFMLDGFSPVKISSAEIEHDLSKISMDLMRIVGAFELYGSKYLAIAPGNVGVVDALWVYSFSTRTWVTWESTPLFDTGGPAAILNNGPDTNPLQPMIFVGTKYYTFDTESLLFSDISYTDDSTAYTATIQTRNLDLGTRKKKRFNRLTLIGSDPREDSNCSVSWSSDDYQTNSTARTLNLNSNDGMPSTTRLGSHRRLSFKITNSSDAAMELEAIELDIDELAV